MSIQYSYILRRVQEPKFEHTFFSYTVDTYVSIIAQESNTVLFSFKDLRNKKVPEIFHEYGCEYINRYAHIKIYEVPRHMVPLFLAFLLS